MSKHNRVRSSHQDQVEKRYRRRLIDLEEIVRQAIDGQKVTLDFLADRVFGVQSESILNKRRVADRHVRELFRVAKTFGHDVSFHPDVDDPKSAWLIVMDRPRVLLRSIQSRLSYLLCGDDRGPSGCRGAVGAEGVDGAQGACGLSA